MTAIHQFSEGAGRLRGVDIFSAGEWRGKTYTHKDLDDIVSNFNRHSAGERPSLRVPAVIGHEEKQELLERSDIPAAGWTQRIYRDGDKLKADFDNIPPQVMRLLKGKAYRSVSSEIYDRPPHGIPDTASGKMLRRVAFLGGDIPQVKSLNEIPVPEDYSESASGFDAYTPTIVRFSECLELPAGCFACFSEVSPMTREEMLAELGQHGLDVAQITDAVPDALLADMCRVLGSQPEPEPEELPPENPEESPPPPPPPDEPHGEYGEQDEYGMPMEARDAEHAQKMFEKAYYHVEKHCGDGAGAKMAEHMRRHGELKITHDTDEPEEGDEHHKPEEEETSMPAKYSEAKLAKMVTAAVARVLKANSDTVKGDLKELKKFREEQLASAKRSAIDARLDNWVREGKVLPREVDPKNPANLRRRLYRADSRATVEKFTEKGKTVELTELDLQMKEIDDRKPFKFSETVKASSMNGKGDSDADTATLEEHFEMFSEQFGRNGMSKEKLVAGYKAERQMNPTLTVKEFLRN